MNCLSKNLHICEFAFFILQKQTKQTFLANLIGRKTASKISPCFLSACRQSGEGGKPRQEEFYHKN